MHNNQKTFLRLKNRSRHTLQSNHQIIFNHKPYSFDNILCTTNINIFTKIVKPLTLDFIKGYNCCLLAYGQTGSGKTYTIQGKMNDVGIIQRVMYYLFETNKECQYRVSYMEIYNEKMYDLLNDFIKDEVVIREDLCNGIIIDNLSIVNVSSYEHFMEIFNRGMLIRKKAQMKNNIESSRSHAIFTIYAEFTDNNIKLKGKYHIVDLAGAERIDVSVSEERQKESGKINKSLLCLGTVIEKLSKKDVHINYRDSKLTFLLKDCLGGNSKLVVIGTIKNEFNIEYFENEENKEKILNDSFVQTKKMRCANHYEILNTLNFLDRVKSIENKAYVNTELEGDIEDVKREYNELYLKYLELKERKVENKNYMHDIDCKCIKQVAKIWNEKYLELVKSFDKFKDQFYEYLDETCKTRMKEIEEMEKVINRDKENNN